MPHYNKQKEKTPMPELPAGQRIDSFDEVALGYAFEDAMNEANRCIHCPTEPCADGCPVGVPISAFVAKVAEGDFAQAYALVKGTNSLPAICGRVCPQETQCEGRCTRGKKGDPVAIGHLERFVADWAFAHPEEAAQPLLPLCKEKRVAIVGSGPASLTCASELVKQGVLVTVFEALHLAGGVLSYGIPEFRLPKGLVAHEIDGLKKKGVKFELNSFIGRLYSIEELRESQGFDAVFIGTGAGSPVYLGIEGEGLNGVMAASELLTRVNLMKAYEFPRYATPVYAGRHCVVVGGGNVAMDAARTARRLGAEVTVVYRRTEAEMPARAEEVHHAKEEGISFQMLANPTRVLGNSEGWACGLECVRMELGEPDESGRRSPVEVEGSTFVIDIDMMVVAIGSRVNPLIAQTTPGLEVSPRGLVVVDGESCATSIPGVYAGGDVTQGSATVILAMGAGKRAAAGILAYLGHH
ncbi:MAG: NADPH-dependent glutamate synthase [Coriobacteriaceae bacterium]|jgi:glutamate synthase (NADPH/NADH) small chain|nr:NADPH-dependent glutamate synthase [Coriobacteriaceae bacterium]